MSQTYTARRPLSRAEAARVVAEPMPKRAGGPRWPNAWALATNVRSRLWAACSRVLANRG